MSKMAEKLQVLIDELSKDPKTDVMYVMLKELIAKLKEISKNNNEWKNSIEHVEKLYTTLK